MALFNHDSRLLVGVDMLSSESNNTVLQSVDVNLQTALLSSEQNGTFSFNVSDINTTPFIMSVESNNSALIRAVAEWKGTQKLTNSSDTNYTFRIERISQDSGVVKVTLNAALLESDTLQTDVSSIYIDVQKSDRDVEKPYLIYSGSVEGNEKNITHIILYVDDNESYISKVDANGLFHIALDAEKVVRYDLLVDSLDGIHAQKWSYDTLQKKFVPHMNNIVAEHQLVASREDIVVVNSAENFIDAPAKNSFTLDIEQNVTLFEGASAYVKNFFFTQRLRNESNISIEMPTNTIVESEFALQTTLQREKTFTYKLHPKTDQSGSVVMRVKVVDSNGETLEKNVSVEVKKSFDIELSETSGMAPLEVSVTLEKRSNYDVDETYCNILNLNDNNSESTTSTIVESNITLENLGFYKLTCHHIVNGVDIQKSRFINVVDENASVIDLQEGANEISLPFQMQLEGNDIDKVFGSDAIDMVFKFSPSGWSYWDNKLGYSKTNQFAKMSSISSRDALYIIANKATTLYFEKPLVNDVNATRDFVFNGWHFTGFNEDKTAPEICTLIEKNTQALNRAKKVEYLWVFKEGKKLFYNNTPEINSSISLDIKRLQQKIKKEDAVWLKIADTDTSDVK